MGEPAHDRANKKRPVLSFRAPSADFKARVQKEADKKGWSVQDYLVHAVESYMDGKAPDIHTIRTVATSKLKRSTDPEKQKLAEALDALKGEWPAE